MKLHLDKMHVIYLNNEFRIWTPVIFWKVNCWHNPLPLHPFQTARHVCKLSCGELLEVHVPVALFEAELVKSDTQLESDQKVKFADYL